MSRETVPARPHVLRPKPTGKRSRVNRDAPSGESPRPRRQMKQTSSVTRRDLLDTRGPNLLGGNQS